MAKICLCLTAKTIGQNLKILEQYRHFADLAELRVDCLEPDERLLIRRFPALAGLPVILTIRRELDGGFFLGGEGSRISLLARGLAFAEEDRRRNFAYIDIEDDLHVPSLEEAARTFGTRIIRSYHNMREVIEDIPGKVQSMRHVGDELVKVALMARSTNDVLRVLQAAKKTGDTEKILLCMGHLGVYTRILAEAFGSFLTYGSALSVPGVPPAAPGQLDIQELAEVYRFRRIDRNTKIYGVTGFPLTASGSPRFFNTVFNLENTDAVYVPFPADSLDDFMELAKELGVSGLSVTVPYKESVLSFLAEESNAVKSIGACNTVSRFVRGWLGANTDALGFSDSLLAFLGKKNLKHRRITVIGAGGAARAVAAEIYRLGGKALILNRTIRRARELALPYKFRWGGVDERGVELMFDYQDIIIQTTSAGMEGSETADPIPLYEFSGEEMVMDLVYKPELPPFLRRASAAGCKVINGYDMLIRQARYQYAHFMGKEFPSQFLSRVQFNKG